jgi:hypothetical protein
MTDKQPTEAQIKEFWEWCGFVLEGKEYKKADFKGVFKVEISPKPDGEVSVEIDGDNVVKNMPNTFSIEQWLDPNYKPYGFKLPRLDLNNLFRYAVPKVMEAWSNHLDISVRRFIAPELKEIVNRFICEIWSDHEGSKMKTSDSPTLALFWAIWEVIHDHQGSQ